MFTSSPPHDDCIDGVSATPSPTNIVDMVFMFDYLKKEVDANTKHHVFESRAKNAGLRNAIEGIHRSSMTSKQITMNNMLIPISR